MTSIEKLTRRAREMRDNLGPGEVPFCANEWREVAKTDGTAAGAAELVDGYKVFDSADDGRKYQKYKVIPRTNCNDFRNSAKWMADGEQYFTNQLDGNGVWTQHICLDKSATLFGKADQNCVTRAHGISCFGTCKCPRKVPQPGAVEPAEWDSAASGTWVADMVRNPYLCTTLTGREKVINKVNTMGARMAANWTVDWPVKDPTSGQVTMLNAACKKLTGCNPAHNASDFNAFLFHDFPVTETVKEALGQKWSTYLRKNQVVIQMLLLPIGGDSRIGGTVSDDSASSSSSGSGSSSSSSSSSGSSSFDLNDSTLKELCADYGYSLVKLFPLVQDALASKAVAGTAGGGAEGGGAEAAGSQRKKDAYTAWTVLSASLKHGSSGENFFNWASENAMDLEKVGVLGLAQADGDAIEIVAQEGGVQARAVTGWAKMLWAISWDQICKAAAELVRIANDGAVTVNSMANITGKAAAPSSWQAKCAIEEELKNKAIEENSDLRSELADVKDKLRQAKLDKKELRQTHKEWKHEAWHRIHGITGTGGLEVYDSLMQHLGSGRWGGEKTQGSYIPNSEKKWTANPSAAQMKAAHRGAVWAIVEGMCSMAGHRSDSAPDEKETSGVELDLEDGEQDVSDIALGQKDVRGVEMDNDDDAPHTEEPVQKKRKKKAVKAKK